MNRPSPRAIDLREGARDPRGWNRHALRQLRQEAAR